ncbi:MAG TPA: lipopolysaccharide transport periplasmic protein LptA [Acidiferrobacter sp.]|nr:lipopolysaccharide transport periplasmic protein LptA [Acidiferrobacter sp.]
MNRGILGILSALCALGLGAYAHADQRAQPLHVRADSIQMDQRTGVSLYKGHVRLVQGDLTIHAAQVRVHSRHGHALSIQAVGNPLRLVDTIPGGVPIFGEAKTLHFEATSDKITLTNQVVFRQGTTVLHGHIVYYSVHLQRVTAIGDPHSRVRARITPHDITHKPKAQP